MKSSILITLVASITGMLVILVITLVLTLSEEKGPPTNYRQFIINNINADNIYFISGFLSSNPHPAGSTIDEVLCEFISRMWSSQGLRVKRLHYDAFLATANSERPNKVAVFNATNGTIFESSPTQPLISFNPPPINQLSIYSFSSFSGLGTAQSSSVVYANYGRDEDFRYLDECNITVNNSIVFIRHGEIFRGDKVRFAETRGAAAVILYTDPHDAAPLGPSNTYPNTVYAPPGATQLGSLKLQGDLLTPGYPAVESAFHLLDSEADTFSIPVQPMSYSDAWHFLSLVKGEEAPASWQGGLNFTYHLGPELAEGKQVAVMVMDLLGQKTVYDVVGFIEGQEEPDRYVIVGNHYDSWTYGGIDPSSATAVLLELVRVFSEMHAAGWRPRRTLLFCNWGAKENGLIGSTEFAEEFSSVLQDRGVVYLNLDLVMTGNHSFMAIGVPMLHDIIFEVAKIVPNPDPSEVKEGRTSIYDTWLDRYPDGPYPRISGGKDVRPIVGTIGTGSDYRAFMFNLGIPSMDMFFTAAPDEAQLPLQHTAYETFFLASKLMDKGLLYHQGCARMLGLLAYEFSMQPLLPYNVSAYTDFINASWVDFISSNGSQLADFDVETESLEAAVVQLVAAGKAFQGNLTSISSSTDALTLRRYNDAMLLLDKAFLAPLGLPGRPLLNHVVLAPSSLNGYVWDTFPRLRDLLRAAQDDQATVNSTNIERLLQQHVAALTHHLNLASRALTFSLW